MKSLLIFLKGLVIGISMLVPGVSGGTMAIIFGIYDDLIHAVSRFFDDWKRNFKLLFYLALGGIFGVLLFSKIIESLLNRSPIIMGFLFIGIVCGGLPTLYIKAKEKNSKKSDIIYLIIGLIIAIALSRDPEALSVMASAGDVKGIFLLFIAGIVISIALILPGISTSFMLLMLGLYSITLNAINTFNIKFLTPILIGVFVGTVATSKVLEYLLNKYPSRTYMLILGFVIGSIIPIYPGLPNGINILYAIIAFICGFAIIYCIGKSNKITN
ncbi:DUF368 domain-containing protein [Clostridium sp. D53t1_180928_C8]|uniref:DUF368 domain-containing protein n=1 Tax=Clostridium sp. D53t1_180928_C8 TaxID=2787101 RepID=UPI0018AB2FE2|nr:DUF368 domain-containing protein [Clostridium sp. D53t1_180928_C8]